MKRTVCHIILCILILFTGTANAEVFTVESVPNVQVSDRTCFVSDPDNFLGEAATQEIDRMLLQLRDSNTVEAAVVVLPSIGDTDIDLFATDLFTHWGIGKKSNSNGLLILTVMDQRQIVFRTGYGIEGVLPDAICKRIINRYITPAFRKGKYGEGMTEAVRQTVKIVMAPEASAELTAEDDSAEDDFNLLYILYGYLLLSFLFSLFPSIKLCKYARRYKNAPYEGYKALNKSLPLMQITAIFFPIWGIINLSQCKKQMNAMREKKRTCENCGTPMHKLSEHDDNAFLTPQEDMEEQIGSIDYDVWMCDKCRNTNIYRFEAQFTKYSECPQCHSKTYSLTRDHIVRPASSLSAGKGEKIYTCSYCKLRKVVPYIIPMIIVPTDNSRGGGFGSGSIGGGFGGGMTGGGGAHGGW